MFRRFSGEVGRPPRVVSGLLKWQVVFGDVLTLIGSFFFAFGSVFVWVFAYAAGIGEVLTMELDALRAEGIVTAHYDTSATVNERPVVESYFDFTASDGQSYTASSYTHKSVPAVGAVVEVEYIQADPSVARIVGQDLGVMPPWVLLFVLIFPTLGLALMLPGVIRGRRAVRLLISGEVAKGRLVGEKATNVRINHRQVLAMTFEFTTQMGKTERAEARTHEPERLRDSEEETLLYDPWNPGKAVLVDALAGTPKSDGAGGFVCNSPGKAFASILLPAGAFIANGAVLLLMLVG